MPSKIITDKKWTKGRILECIKTDLDALGFEVHDKQLIADDESIVISIELDTQLVSGVGIDTLTDVYFKFFAVPKMHINDVIKLWPAAMDLNFITREMDGVSTLEHNSYRLAVGEPYGSSCLAHDIRRYAFPFFQAIQSEKGYLDFIFRQSLIGRDRAYCLDEFDAQDIHLIIMGITLATKLNNEPLVTKGNKMLKSILEHGNSVQKGILERIFKAKPSLAESIFRNQP